MANNIDPTFLFTLRPRKGLTVKAYELFHKHTNTHMYFTIEVKENGRVLFPKGQQYAGVSVFAGDSIDGKAAKSLALALLAMKPGDTDSEYFDSYSEDQLDWARENGEEIELIRYNRFGED